MKNKVSKQNIVDALILESDFQINSAYKSELEKSLINKFSIKLFNMNKVITATLGVFTLLIVGLMAYNFYMPKQMEKSVYDSVQTQLDNKQDDNQGDAAIGSKLAVDDHSSISQAKEVLSFSPLKPTLLFGGLLERVQTGRTFDGSKSDMIFLSFAKDNENYFQVSQVKYNSDDFVKPENTEELSIKVNNSNVTAYYYVNSVDSIDPNSEMSLYDGPIAKAGLVFNLNNINFDISAFGTLSKENLVEIAQSLE